MKSECDEGLLLDGILSQARVDGSEIRRLLSQSHVRASDLIAEPEHRVEAMLQRAGLVVGDIFKIVRALRGFHSDGGGGGGASSQPQGKAARGSRNQPTMRCGLIVYSTTVLIVTLTILSFYLPAMIYHVRSTNHRMTRSTTYSTTLHGHYSLPAALGGLPAGGAMPAPRGPSGARVMMVTANQPLPCTTRRGDWIMELALRNKLMYATLHDYKTWWSTELVSAWDLEAAWNKIPLLYVLMHPESPVTQGVEWLLWMDDDAIFTDMNFTMPLEQYDRDGINLVIWGDPQRVYRANDIQGLNTGVFLLRKCEWSRQLMAEVAALATPSIRRQIGNKGRIAEQGALTWVLHSQAERWKDRVQLERNFTLNGNWMDYAKKWVPGKPKLALPVWGNDAIPFVVQYAGCQMCRGHSENGSWHDGGVRKCQNAFIEAYTFGDDQVLSLLGLRHLTMDTHLVRASAGSELYQRHQRMTRCLPSFLVIGTQKGGTSSFHFLLKSGWHDAVRVNSGEKEIHYFSWDDQFRQGPLTYQQRFDGSGDRLGECAEETKLRGEVSATYLDYPKAAERAAMLLPSARIVVLLREPVARLVSSFNMKWQVEICGKLTWSRTDCYNGVTSMRVINENNVAPKQRAAAVKVWNECSVDKKGLDHDCLRRDFVDKLSAAISDEERRLGECAKPGAFEELGSCLGVQGLEQAKLYALMEGALFLYRSMYSEHLAKWLKVYPAEQLLVIPSERLKEAGDMKDTMGRFARFMGLSDSGAEVHNDLIFKSSPAAKGVGSDGHVHENGRTYIAEAPADLAEKIHKILCPKNQELAQLLLDKKLIAEVGDMPWLATALKRDIC
mmetsp:Transcript_25146/g.81887  ORF Transcript_25146/g.81887 Transcript_25146/m.81887 type:complete len:839 (+) Transcript_25146:3-2519(+)